MLEIWHSTVGIDEFTTIATFWYSLNRETDGNGPAKLCLMTPSLSFNYFVLGFWLTLSSGKAQEQLAVNCNCILPVVIYSGAAQQKVPILLCIGSTLHCNSVNSWYAQIIRGQQKYC